MSRVICLDSVSGWIDARTSFPCFAVKRDSTKYSTGSTPRDATRLCSTRTLPIHSALELGMPGTVLVLVLVLGACDAATDTDTTRRNSTCLGSARTLDAKSLVAVESRCEASLFSTVGRVSVSALLFCIAHYSICLHVRLVTASCYACAEQAVAALFCSCSTSSFSSSIASLNGKDRAESGCTRHDSSQSLACRLDFAHRPVTIETRCAGESYPFTAPVDGTRHLRAKNALALRQVSIYVIPRESFKRCAALPEKE